MAKKDQRLQPRLDGIRIPKEGTVSWQIYMLMANGNSQRRAATLLEKNYSTVRSLVHMMRNPDYHNRKRNEQRAKLQRPGPAPPAGSEERNRPIVGERAQSATGAEKARSDLGGGLPGDPGAGVKT